MFEIWTLVVGIAFLMALSVTLEPLSKHLRFPHSVMLVIVGALFVLLISSLPQWPGAAAPWRDALDQVTQFSVTGDVILFLFLPALVFESALSLQLRWLRRDLATIIFLAIIGVLISSFVVGATLSYFTGAAIVVCLLIGAIVSATDPVAVIALFKDLGAPRRLTVLVEGESLFNDATAIVIAGILIELITMSAVPNTSEATIEFIRVFGVGTIAGFLIARFFLFFMRRLGDNVHSVATLAIITPFIAFAIVEHFLHASGVMAVVMCGLSIGNYGRRTISPDVFSEIHNTWENIARWATGLIFLLVGMTVPKLLGAGTFSYFDEALIVFGVATLIRFVTIFAAMPMLSYAGLAQRLSRGFQVVMVWGGLRGAVSLALALIVLDTPNIPEATRTFIVELVTLFVLSTLLLQATTIGKLMEWLGLRGLRPAEQQMRNRSVDFVRTQVGEELVDLLENQGKEVARFGDILSRYELIATNPDDEDTGEIADWARRGMLLALSQERQLYLSAFGEGAISAERRVIILDRIDEVMDELAAIECVGDDLTKLTSVVEDSVRHTRAFERALKLYRMTGIVQPMAQTLTWRFNGLSAIRSAIVRFEQDDRLEEICALLPKRAQPAFLQLYETRKESVASSYNALLRQHPLFAHAVDRYNIRRTGFRLEKRGYEQLKDHGLIGPEVYNQLIRDLGRQDDPRPVLQLHFDRLELLRRLPAFNRADKATQKQLAKRLKHSFLLPGDVIFEVGDEADGMYFISDGAVTLKFVSGQIVQLGTGDFFGELSLIKEQNRVASATSDAYSTLLRLDKHDFARVMRQSPALAEEIEKVAEVRQQFPAKSVQ